MYRASEFAIPVPVVTVGRGEIAETTSTDRVMMSKKPLFRGIHSAFFLRTLYQLCSKVCHLG